MKLVLVEWIDSHSGNGWQRLDQIKKQGRTPVHCRSVGWLVSRTSQCTVLVPHISGEKNGDIVLFGCGELTIPNRAIRRVRVLQRG